MTLLVVVVSEPVAPVHVVDAAGEVAMVSEFGNVVVSLDCVRSNAFELLKVIVSVDGTVTPTLDGAKTSPIVGADGLTASAVGQAWVPAVDGALAVALVDEIVIAAVSVLPKESATVRVRMPVPDTETCALPAPE